MRVQPIKTIIHSVILIFPGLFFTCLHGYPVQAQRYVQEKDGNIIKVVDLIYDVHVALNDEHGHFDAGSEQLLSQLKTLAQQNNERVELFLETDGNEQLPPDIRVDFLTHLACQLPELQKNMLDGLSFTPADTYRSKNTAGCFLRLLKELPQWQTSAWKHTKVAPTVTPFFTQFLWQPSPPEKNLQAIENKIDKNRYNFLHSKWQQHKKVIRIFYDTYFKHIIEQQKEITFDAFWQEIKNNKQTAQFINQLEKAVANIMDFELLLKLLISEHHHCVIYAGAFHCSRLVDILVQQCNCTQIANEAEFDFKAHCDERNVMKRVKPLPPHAFDFLTEKPEALQAKSLKPTKQQKLSGITKKTRRKKSTQLTQRDIRSYLTK